MDNTETNFSTDNGEAPPKKETRPGAFIVLGLAILGGGGYLFFKHGPASAGAATAAVADSNEAQKSISEFLQLKGGGISSIEKGLSNTEQMVKQFNTYASMTQVPLNDLSSNPFRADSAAPAEPGAPTPVAPPSTESAKLEAQKKATEAVAKLKVGSILTGRKGASASAMINGELVRVGDHVEGFKVESIKPGVVVVTDGTHHFERRINGN